MNPSMSFESSVLEKKIMKIITFRKHKSIVNIPLKHTPSVLLTSFPAPSPRTSKEEPRRHSYKVTAW